MAGNKNSGGARVGAGRKRKPLSEKIIDGTQSQRNMTVMQFDNIPELEGKEMPSPSDFLSTPQSEGTDLQANKLYQST